MSIVSNLNFEKRGTSTQLFVLLHAFRKNPLSLEHVRKRIENHYPNADLLIPELPYKNFYSIKEPEEIIAELLIGIDGAWNNRKLENPEGYERIVLIGHSIGALYARKLYVCACGETEHAPFEPILKDYIKKNGGKSLDSIRDWAKIVDRIILLAGLNRGWSISPHLSLRNAIGWSIGSFLGSVVMATKLGTPTIFSIRRGATFVTQLRIQWLAMRQKARCKSKVDTGTQQNEYVGCAIVVQLLGTIDDLVSPEDNIDLVAGRDFLYFDIPGSGHKNVIEMDDTVTGHERAKVFFNVLTQPWETLKEKQILPSDDVPNERPEVTDVVFVIHGIRDKGYWTHKIARRVIAEGLKQNPKRIIASVTSTYGYFPMLSFLWPSHRREKVEWLMDQYAEALAKYPNAGNNFYYIGHSNGTYLAARALEEYPCCRFKRIAFAGSVVHKNYNWSHLLPLQNEAVANYVATTDWVVALFPKALQSMHLQDLGSAGHDGFEDLQVLQLTEMKEDKTSKPQFIVGKHDAALKEEVWKSIVDFILTGNLATTVEMEKAKLVADEQTQWLRFISERAPICLLLLALLVFTPVLLLVILVDSEWQKTLFIAGYVLSIWIVLTRV